MIDYHSPKKKPSMKLYVIEHQIDGEKKNTHGFCGSQKFLRLSSDAFPLFFYINSVLTVSQRMDVPGEDEKCTGSGD